MPHPTVFPASSPSFALIDTKTKYSSSSAGVNGAFPVPSSLKKLILPVTLSPPDAAFLGAESAISERPLTLKLALSPFTSIFSSWTVSTFISFLSISVASAVVSTESLTESTSGR